MNNESEIEQSNVDIVVSGFNENKSDNDILSDLFRNGVEFSDVRRVFNSVIREKNLRLTAKERKEKINELLSEWQPNVDDSEALQSRIELIKSELKLSDTKAVNALKLWAKENQVILPKPIKKQRTPKEGFGGVLGVILEHALENRDMGYQGLKEFCENNGINTNYAKTALNVITFAKKWESHT